MATVTTVTLALPYPIRRTEAEAIERGYQQWRDEAAAAERDGRQPPLRPQTLDELRRAISEAFVMKAASDLYPGGMARRDQRVFSRVKAVLDEETPTVELDGTTAEFLVDMFLGRDAEEKVKIAPQHAHLFGVWLDHMEEVRRAIREQEEAARAAKERAAKESEEQK